VDADPWSQDRARSLADIVLEVAPVPVIALSGWIIPGLASEVEACDVRGLCSKFDAPALIKLISSGRQRSSRCPGG